MDTRFGRRTQVKGLMIVIGSVIFARSTVGDFFNLQPFPESYGVYANLFGVALFLGAILWHFYDLQNKISIYETTRPNIVFDGFILEPPFRIFRGNVAGESVERYYIALRNEKTAGLTVVA